MELVGAIKIKDGLFLGDEFAAQDLEFVVANKVSHVINTAARQIPNHWEPIGVQYLDFYWLDQDSQQLFDSKDEVVAQFCSFIDRAVSVGESVLVHSVRGQCRSVVVIVAYLMRKHRWSMVKSFEFVSSRRPDLSTRPAFIQQLLAFESRLNRQFQLAADWESLPQDPEELVLRNTFLNSQFGQIAEMTIIDGKEKVNKLNWTDCGENSTQLIDLDRPGVQNRVDNGFVVLRSCMKGGKALGEVRVPLPVQMERRSLRPKNDLVVTPGKLAKAAEMALEYGITATLEEADAVPRRKPPALDVTPSAKKPRAASAGTKDPSPKQVTNIRKLRSGGLQLAVTNSRPSPAAKTIGPYSSQVRPLKKATRPGSGLVDSKAKTSLPRAPVKKKSVLNS